MQPSCLGIPTYRRIAGLAMVGLMYATGVVELADFAQGGRLTGFSHDYLVLAGAVLLTAALVATPFIAYPCLFDRFPNWIVGFYPKSVLDQLTALLVKPNERR